MATAPALTADSTGGNSDLDSKRLSSWRAPTLFCTAPFPLSIKNYIVWQYAGVKEYANLHLIQISEENMANTYQRPKRKDYSKMIKKENNVGIKHHL